MKGARKPYKRQKVVFLRFLMIIREFREINPAIAIEQTKRWPTSEGNRIPHPSRNLVIVIWFPTELWTT